MFGYFNDDNFGVDNPLSYDTENDISDGYNISYTTNEETPFNGKSSSLNQFQFNISQNNLQQQSSASSVLLSTTQPFMRAQESIFTTRQSFQPQYQLQQPQSLQYNNLLQQQQQQFHERHAISPQLNTQLFQHQLQIPPPPPPPQQHSSTTPTPTPSTSISSTTLTTSTPIQTSSSLTSSSSSSHESEDTKPVTQGMTIPPITYDDRGSGSGGLDNSLTPEQPSAPGGSPEEKIVPLYNYVIPKGNKCSWEAQKATLISSFFPGGLPLPAILNDGKFSENLIRLRRHKISTLTEDNTGKSEEVNSIERLILRIPHKTLVCMSIEGFSAYEAYLNSNFVLNYNQKSELKYQKTLIRNREAVRETRKKSVSKISQLQSKVLELENSINTLSDENKYLKEQNVILMSQNNILRSMVYSKQQQQSQEQDIANDHQQLPEDMGMHQTSTAMMIPEMSQTCNLPEIVNGGKRDGYSFERKDSGNNSIASNNDSNGDDMIQTYRDAKRQRISLNYVCFFFGLLGFIIKVFCMSPVANLYELYGQAKLGDMTSTNAAAGRRKLLTESVNDDPNIVSVSVDVNVRKIFIGIVVTPFIFIFLLVGKKLSYKQIHKK